VALRIAAFTILVIGEVAAYWPARRALAAEPAAPRIGFPPFARTSRL